MSEHWKRSVNFRNLNSKVKGNVRPGEEQLGDGIVRPSYDVTARHKSFCRTYLRPKRANAGDPYAGLKYIDQVFICTCSGTQWFLQPEPLARLTTDLWYWSSMSTDASRESLETSVVGTEA